MPILTTSAEDAQRISFDNPEGPYPFPNRDPERLHPLPRVRPTTKFRLSDTDTFFAVGSQLAQAMGNELRQRGFAVHSSPTGSQALDLEGYLFCANPLTLLQELRSALEPARYPRRTTQVELNGGNIDLLSTDHRPTSAEECQSRQKRFTQLLAQIVRSSTVLLVLGEAEIWFDRNTQTFLRGAPPTPILDSSPERFEVRVLSYDDITLGLEAIEALVLHHGAGPIRFVTAVCPIPAAQTYRACDVLEASAYSKSVMRAALEAFCLDRPHAVYFPGLETINLANREMTWGPGNYRALSDTMIRYLADRFVEAYLPA